MTDALDVDVSHRAGDFHLHARFTVRSGLAVLFGPSGSGKSLTLSLIAGLTRPDGGSIRIAGRVVAGGAGRVHVPTQDRRVGMVFQDGLLLPHRSVLDNVALAVRDVRSRSERRLVAGGWLERVGAQDLGARKPRTLSGGQRQRVALARSLAGAPRLLLLDEPLSALDLDTRRHLRGLLREVIAASGVPSLLVTHDAVEADELGDVILDYDGGRVTGTRRGGGGNGR